MSRSFCLWMTCRLLLLLAGSGLPAYAKADDQKQTDDKSFRGRLILFGVQSEGKQEAVTIRSMSADGNEVRTLLTLPEGVIEGGRVSPDGLRLAYGLVSKDRKDLQLWLFDPGGKPRMILSRGGLATAWSPDGKQIAFYRRAGKDDRDFLRTGGQGGERRRTVCRGQVGRPSWR
jgi:Tol biopolymer transport system component